VGFSKLPGGRNLVGSKSVFKKNMNATRQVEKFKAQLVAKGYSQVKGIEFDEIFSPVAKLISIRVLMSMAVRRQCSYMGTWKKKST
jgi:hypothetical protein